MKRIIADGVEYKQEKNVVHFILSDEERPDWSKALDEFLLSSKTDLEMKTRYKNQAKRTENNEQRKRFGDFVSSVRGVKVDLASGPSGYFSYIVDRLEEGDVFVATDACPSVITAHAEACDKENFVVFDVNLDKPLPLRNESVDIFTGNYLNNVDNYGELLREVHRCLKPGGKLAVIELFFEEGGKTSQQLIKEGAIWASLETFKAYCESSGFIYMDGDVTNTMKGKIDPKDLYPLDENERCEERTLYFMKE